VARRGVEPRGQQRRQLSAGLGKARGRDPDDDAMNAVRRWSDQHGHRWPITGHVCTVRRPTRCAQRYRQEEPSRAANPDGSQTAGPVYQPHARRQQVLI